MLEESRLDDGVEGWCEKAVAEGGREPGAEPVLANEVDDLEAWDDEPAEDVERVEVDFLEECLGRDEMRMSLLEWGG